MRQCQSGRSDNVRPAKETQRLRRSLRQQAHRCSAGLRALMRKQPRRLRRGRKSRSDAGDAEIRTDSQSPSQARESMRGRAVLSQSCEETQRAQTGHQRDRRGLPQGQQRAASTVVQAEACEGSERSKQSRSSGIRAVAVRAKAREGAPSRALRRRRAATRPAIDDRRASTPPRSDM